MQTKIKLMTIAASVLLALALQVSELSAFGSPVERPAPPRPTPPPVQVDTHRKASGHSQSKHEASQAPLTLASVDGAGLVWAMVWESK